MSAEAASHQKHEEALADLSKRRAEQAARMKAKRTAAIVGKGASSGRKFKNKHMEDFQQLKRKHRAKRGEHASAIMTSGSQCIVVLQRKELGLVIPDKVPARSLRVNTCHPIQCHPSVNGQLVRRLPRPPVPPQGALIPSPCVEERGAMGALRRCR